MSLPHITSLHELYSSETQPFRKVHRMVDLFESIIKTYTAIIMAEYFRRGEVSNAVKGLLANGLRTPSLGTWQYFSRELYRELQEASHEFLLRDFEQSFDDLERMLSKSDSNVISFRNSYAHGATPPDEQCIKDITFHTVTLTKLLGEKWISASNIEIREGKVFLICAGAELCLHPILVERPEPGEPWYSCTRGIQLQEPAPLE